MLHVIKENNDILFTSHSGSFFVFRQSQDDNNSPYPIPGRDITSKTNAKQQEPGLYWKVLVNAWSCIRLILVSNSNEMLTFISSRTLYIFPIPTLPNSGTFLDSHFNRVVQTVRSSLGTAVIIRKGWGVGGAQCKLTALGRAVTCKFLGK